MLTISIEDFGKNVTLHCAGRLVRGEEAAILCAALRHRERDITVDLARVDAIDAAGLGALVSLQAAGVYLRLSNPIGVVRETLRVAHLDSVFEIEGFQTSAKFDADLKPMAVAV
jgi:anti-anti-sigma regulatory factor